MCINFNFQYLININTNMSIIFKNNYKYKYNSMSSESVPLSSLVKVNVWPAFQIVLSTRGRGLIKPVLNMGFVLFVILGHSSSLCQAIASRKPKND